MRPPTALAWMSAALVCFYASAAWSQSSNDAPPSGLSEEAAYALEQCESYPTHALLHDCSCIAEAFAEARAAQPETGWRSVYNDVTSRCPDTAGAAQYAYPRCAESFPFMGIEADSEEHCTCVSQVFSRLFTENPTGNSRGLGRMMTDAHSECRTDL